MANLPDARRKIKIAFAVLAAVDVAAVAIFFSPLVGSQRDRNEQMNQLWKEQRQKDKQVEPLRGLDKKVVAARREIDAFYKDRLPGRDSSISESLGRVASKSGVKIGHVKYTFNDLEPVGLRPVLVDATLSGNYLQLMQFINSLERDQLFFIVDSVELAGQQGGVVGLQVRLETYLKAGA